MSDTTSKDDELRDKIYDIVEVNVENTDTGKEYYAIDPEKLLRLIKQYGIQERIDERVKVRGLLWQYTGDSDVYRKNEDDIAELTAPKQQSKEEE